MSSIQGLSGRPVTVIGPDAEPAKTQDARATQPAGPDVKREQVAVRQALAESLKDRFEVSQPDTSKVTFGDGHAQGPMVPMGPTIMIGDLGGGTRGLMGLELGTCNIESLGLRKVDDMNKAEGLESQHDLAVETFTRVLAQTMPKDDYMGLKNGTGNLVGILG